MLPDASCTGILVRWHPSPQAQRDGLQWRYFRILGMTSRGLEMREVGKNRCLTAPFYAHCIGRFAITFATELGRQCSCGSCSSASVANQIAEPGCSSAKVKRHSHFRRRNRRQSEIENCNGRWFYWCHRGRVQRSSSKYYSVPNPNRTRHWVQNVPISTRPRTSEDDRQVAAPTAPATLSDSKVASATSRCFGRRATRTGDHICLAFCACTTTRPYTVN